MTDVAADAAGEGRTVLSERSAVSADGRYRMTEQRRELIDPSITLTQNEALLAVLVEHLDEQVGILRFALSGLLQDVYGRDRCNSGQQGDFAALAMESLYPGHSTVLPAMRQAPTTPFPSHWLGTMARSGRSLAQVVRGRADAVSRVAHALAP